MRLIGRLGTLGALGMLAGCDGGKGATASEDSGDDTGPPPCAEVTLYPDQDGDGYGDRSEAGEVRCPETGWSEDATDCDDTDPGAFPGAAETCDEVDNDCDGELDEGVLATWYLDADGDGYGLEADAIQACEALGSYTAAEAGDCDDDDASVTGPTAWHPDADGDGFGAPDWEEWACEAPEGGVADATDCDDADGGVYPGAVEVCDGVDQDCDGVVDWGDRALSLDGDGDYVLISRTDEVLDLGVDSVTIEAWILTDDDSAAARIWSKGSFGWSPGYMLRTHSGVVLAEMSGPYGYGVACSGSTSIADGAWHHVAASFDRDASVLSVVVDGLEDASCSLSSIADQSVSNASNPTIGIYDGDLAEEPFSGKVGEVRLWSTSRDAASIADAMCAPLADLPEDLVGYWPLQTDVLDATGPGHDGTLGGDAILTSR